MNLLSYLTLASAFLAGGLAISLGREVGRTKLFRAAVWGAGSLLFLYNVILVFVFGLEPHPPAFLAVVGLAAPFFLLVPRLAGRSPTPLEVLELQLRDAVPEALWILNKEGVVAGTNGLAEVYQALQDQTGRLGHPLSDSPEFVQAWILASQNLCDPHEGTGRLFEASVTWRFSPAYDRFGDFLGGSVTVSGLEGNQGALAGLSEREQEVVALLAEGLDNSQIAERLFISQGTVKNHIHKILAKTGKSTRSQLVASSRVRKS